MKNSSFIKALSSLNTIEMREFRKFVNSPFFNGRKEVVLFFSEVKKYYPSFDSSKFSSERLFAKMFPGKKYDAQTMRRLSSFSLKLLESYLAYTGVRDDGFYFDLSLAIEYSKRGNYKLSDKKTKIIDKKYKENKGDYEFYFWERYLIERHKNTLYAYTGNDHLASESIIKRTDLFSYHTAVVICKSLVSLCINEKNFNSDYSKSDFYLFVKNLQLENYIKNLSKKESDIHSVLYAEYYQAMSLLNPDSNEYFERFKLILKKELSQFSHIERLNFYSIFEAICTLKIENGEEGFEDDLFDAYRRMLAEGLYSYHAGGEIILRLFRNIVHMAVLLKQYDWLEMFIKEYTLKLPVDSQRNMQNLADALLCFEKGQFGESLDKLNKIDYELFHFKIDVKNLQLKLYYELGYNEELISAADTYRHFILNNKFISQRYRILCSGFVNYLTRINRLKTVEFNIDNCEFIKKEIESSKGYLYKQWLLEKVNAMKELFLKNKKGRY